MWGLKDTGLTELGMREVLASETIPLKIAATAGRIIKRSSKHMVSVADSHYSYPTLLLSLYRLKHVINMSLVCV